MISLPVIHRDAVSGASPLTESALVRADSTRPFNPSQNPRPTGHTATNTMTTAWRFLAGGARRSLTALQSLSTTPLATCLGQGSLMLAAGCDLPEKLSENAATVGALTVMGGLAGFLHEHQIALSAASIVFLINFLSSFRSHIKEQDRETIASFLGTALVPYKNSEMTRVIGAVQALVVGAGVGIFENFLSTPPTSATQAISVLLCAIVPGGFSAYSSFSVIFGNSMLAEWLVPRLNDRLLKKNGLKDSTTDTWATHTRHFDNENTTNTTHAHAKNFANYAAQNPQGAATLLKDMLELSLNPTRAREALYALCDIIRSSPEDAALSGILLKTMPTLFDGTPFTQHLHTAFFLKVKDPAQRAEVLNEMLSMYENPNHILRRQLHMKKGAFKQTTENSLLNILSRLTPEEAERVLSAFGAAHPKMPANLLQKIIGNLPFELKAEDIQTYFYGHTDVVASVDIFYLSRQTPHQQIKSLRKHIDNSASCHTTEIIPHLIKMGLTLQNINAGIRPHVVEITVEAFARRALPNGKRLTANELRAYLYGQLEIAGKRSLFDDRNFEIISEPFRAQLAPMTLEEGEILTSDLVDPNFLMSETFLSADPLTRLTYLKRAEALANQDENSSEALRIKTAIEIAREQSRADISEKRTATLAPAVTEESIISRARRAWAAGQKKRQ